MDVACTYLGRYEMRRGGGIFKEGLSLDGTIINAAGIKDQGIPLPLYNPPEASKKRKHNESVVHEMNRQPMFRPNRDRFRDWLQYLCI